jgi:hypothetical protein
MSGAWEDVATVLKSLPPEWDDAEIMSELRAAVDKTIGVDSSAYGKGQYKILLYEGWLNLPGQDRDRFCQLHIDRTTQTVLSMRIYEEVDPFEKRRFEFEQQQLQAWQESQAEVQAFLAEKRETQMAALEMAHTADPTGDGPTQGIAMSRMVEEMPAPEELPMPDWMGGDPMATPRPPDGVPIRMFAQGINIEPLQGTLGLGTGLIHANQNIASNVALSAFNDQAQLGNLKNFLAKGNVRFPGGDSFQVKPGAVHKITGASDLSKDILPIDFGPANAQLLTLIEMFSKDASAVSNTPEVLAGEAGKSGETAQGISARIEQATKMLSVPTGKYADFLSQVLENNAKLNATFLEDVEFFSVNNHDPALGETGRQNFSVGRHMYDRPYDVEISADLKFTSTAQRIAEADALVQLGNSVEAMKFNYAFQYETVKKSLEARNRYDLVALMGPAPPPPQVFGAPTSPPAPPPGMAPPGAPPGQPGAQQPPQGAPAPQQGAPQ